MNASRFFVIVFLGFLIFGAISPGFVTGKNPHQTPTPDPTETPPPTETPAPTTPEPTPTDTPTPTETPNPTTTTPEPSTSETPTPTASPTETPVPTTTTTTTTTVPPTTVQPTLTDPVTIIPTSAVVTTETVSSSTTTARPASGNGGGGAGGGGGAFVFPKEDTALPADWYSLETKGATITTEGEKQKIFLDLVAAGDAIDLFGNRIVFKNEGMQVIIETEETFNAVDNVVSGTIKNATVKTEPIIGETKKIGGKFMVMFETTYSEAPPAGSRMKVTLSEAPTGDILSSFQNGAKGLGFEIKHFAYVMNVRTLNVSPLNPVKITMSVSPEWVTTSGGRNVVRIVRVADDGTTEILETRHSGYDQFGNYIFVAESPHGFSTFGLVTIAEASALLSIPLSSPVPMTSSEPPSALSTTQSVLIPAHESALRLPWFIIPGLVVLLIGVSFVFVYLIVLTKKGCK